MTAGECPSHFAAVPTSTPARGSASTAARRSACGEKRATLARSHAGAKCRVPTGAGGELDGVWSIADLARSQPSQGRDRARRCRAALAHKLGHVQALEHLDRGLETLLEVPLQEGS